MHNLICFFIVLQYYNTSSLQHNRGKAALVQACYTREGVPPSRTQPRPPSFRTRFTPPARFQLHVSGAIICRQSCAHSQPMKPMKPSLLVSTSRASGKKSSSGVANGGGGGGGGKAARSRKGSRGGSSGEPFRLHSSLHGMEDFRLIPRWSFFTQALREPEEKMKTSIGVSCLFWGRRAFLTRLDFFFLLLSEFAACC